MVVNLRKKRELIARILGLGLNRVRFEPDKLEDVGDAITREDMRSLIENRTVWTVKEKGTSRARAEAKRKTRHKRGLASGSKKGKKTARTGKKEVYVAKVRSLRRHLRVLKDRNDISREVYWVMYKKIKGGQVRSSTHLRELAKQARSHSSTT